MKALRTCLLLAGAVLALTGSGCSPFSMGIFTPIPVQPWMVEMVESRFNNFSDYNTVVLGPIPPGYRPLCEDIPDRAAILRAMPPTVRGIPYVYEEFREDYDFTVERLVDTIDPPRFFPLIGPAQLHHCHFKCTVYFTETTQSDWPVAFQTHRRRVEVVYMDRDHLHTFACTPEQVQSMTRDLMGIQP
jgi:hypothetical protein